MAITNQEAIRFSNEKIRPGADRIVRLYNAAKSIVNEWNANNYGGTILPNDDPTSVIRDSASPNDDIGTGGDGRKVITTNDVHNIINRLTEFVSDYEANTNAKLNTSLKVAVNPIP